jgi:hypothetical protein
MLLICVHGGFLWLDREVSIDTQLIMRIIRLPSTGEEPLPLFTDKSKDKSLSKKMKYKYDTHRGARSLNIASINDDTIRFTMHVLVCMLLRKCHKYQVLAGVIAAIEKGIAGVQMN